MQSTKDTWLKIDKTLLSFYSIFQLIEILSDLYLSYKKEIQS
jgi:hypothetical protein